MKEFLFCIFVLAIHCLMGFIKNKKVFNKGFIFVLWLEFAFVFLKGWDGKHVSSHLALSAFPLRHSLTLSLRLSVKPCLSPWNGGVPSLCRMLEYCFLLAYGGWLSFQCVGSRGSNLGPTAPSPLWSSYCHWPLWSFLYRIFLHVWAKDGIMEVSGSSLTTRS